MASTRDHSAQLRMGSQAPRCLDPLAKWALAAILLGLGGCEATTRPVAPGPLGTADGTADPVGTVPGDLWLEIRVEPGRLVGEQARVEERSARFVLLSDGTLHGEVDRLPEPGRRPARIRRLSREQMVDVWTALRAAGFSDPSLAETRGNPALLTPGPEEILASLEVHANGERAVFVRRYKAGEDAGTALRRAIRTVAMLAWASDEPRADTLELPLRYDLGPDPYARFKSSGAPSNSRGDAK